MLLVCGRNINSNVHSEQVKQKTNPRAIKSLHNNHAYVYVKKLTCEKMRQLNHTHKKNKNIVNIHKPNQQLQNGNCSQRKQ